MRCGYPSVTVWAVQCLHSSQEGQVVGNSDCSRGFAINAGIREGCVLSPKLFTCVVQWAMATWRRRATASDFGIDLHDGMPKLLDLTFADDVLFFASSAHEATALLDLLTQNLAATGLLLNAHKTCYSHKRSAAPFTACSFQWAGHSSGVW